MREPTGNYSNTGYHDTDGNILTDIWKGKDPPNVGMLWLNYFHDAVRKNGKA